MTTHCCTRRVGNNKVVVSPSKGTVANRSGHHTVKEALVGMLDLLRLYENSSVGGVTE